VSSHGERRPERDENSTKRQFKEAFERPCDSLAQTSWQSVKVNGPAHVMFRLDAARPAELNSLSISPR
jgi:hypothetical protein